MAKNKKSQVKKDFSRITTLSSGLSELKKYRVKIGILTGKASLKHGEFKTNVEIGAIQEFGSIKANIPKRSFIRFPIEHKRKDLKKKLRKNKDKIIEYIEEGNTKKIFTNIGLEAEGIIQDAFNTRGFGKWVDNAPITIFLKGSDAPLIDTGQLRRTITSKVIKK